MPEKNSSEISTKTLRLRLEHGLTSKRLAALMSVTPKTIRNIETGRSTPSRRTTQMLKKTLFKGKEEFPNMPYRGNVKQPEPGTLGAALREIRVDRDLTLIELEELSGIGASALSTYELNKSQPSPHKLNLLTEALGFTPDDPEALAVKRGRPRRST